MSQLIHQGDPNVAAGSLSPWVDLRRMRAGGQQTLLLWPQWPATRTDRFIEQQHNSHTELEFEQRRLFGTGTWTWQFNPSSRIRKSKCVCFSIF